MHPHLFPHPEQRVDHRVAGYHDSVWRDPFREEHLTGSFGRSKMQIGQHGRHAPIDFLWERRELVVRPKARLDMANADARVGNPSHDNTRYCLAQADSLYLVYLPNGGTTELDLGSSAASYQLAWFNPRAGGPLQRGSMAEVKGPGKVNLGQPPAQPDADWLVIVRRL